MSNPVLSVDVADKLSPALRQVAAQLRGAGRLESHQVMGEEVQLATVAHLRGLAGSRHATANRLGATPSNFLAGAVDAAAAASVVQPDSEGVTLRLRHPAIARAFRDIRITAKRGSALTIPIHALAYNRRAAQFPTLFRLPGTNVLVIPQAGDAPLALFVLVRSVTKKQDRSLMPSADEIHTAAARGFTAFVRRTLQQARLN